jgi:glycine betaine/proline transport system substrate-binding protein
MSSVLAWKDENNASAEEAAVYYLQNYKDQWSGWLSDEARQNLASILDQG